MTPHTPPESQKPGWGLGAGFEAQGLTTLAQPHSTGTDVIN